MDVVPNIVLKECDEVVVLEEKLLWGSDQDRWASGKSQEKPLDGALFDLA